MKRIVLSLLIGASLYAQEDSSNIYLGLGWSTSTFNNYEYSNDNNSNIYADSSGYKVYGGYNFNKIIGVELSYNDYGTFKSSRYYTQSVSSISIAANVGYGFLDNQLRPFVVMGISYLDTNQNQSYYNNSSAAMHFGAGVEYFPKMFKGVGFRLALEGDNIPQGNHSYDDYHNNTGSVNVRSYVNYYGALAFKF